MSYETVNKEESYEFPGWCSDGRGLSVSFLNPQIIEPMITDTLK
jgi:hypothetical protein